MNIVNMVDSTPSSLWNHAEDLLIAQHNSQMLNIHDIYARRMDKLQKQYEEIQRCIIKSFQSKIRHLRSQSSSLTNVSQPRLSFSRDFNDNNETTISNSEFESQSVSMISTLNPMINGDVNYNVHPNSNVAIIQQSNYNSNRMQAINASKTQSNLPPLALLPACAHDNNNNNNSKSVLNTLNYKMDQVNDGSMSTLTIPVEDQSANHRSTVPQSAVNVQSIHVLNRDVFECAHDNCKQYFSSMDELIDHEIYCHMGPLLDQNNSTDNNNNNNNNIKAHPKSESMKHETTSDNSCIIFNICDEIPNDRDCKPVEIMTIKPNIMLAKCNQTQMKATNHTENRMENENNFMLQVANHNNINVDENKMVMKIQKKQRQKKKKKKKKTQNHKDKIDTTPFQCLQCSKQYSTIRGLRNHERVHTGEKPFQCEKCLKKFTFSAQLTRHRNNVKCT